ncbi:guanine nucleotide exchange c9orf72 [Anaeramoeba flamelloides]|uniref:Guanine nucleotide exchange c9orf72 n=1 Tax=Anaeramoeba flamelloides TaxID=1746091 RepID=A0ABQ8X1S5_9EUKA|nr:guanine nucleotide exchange c9orf72 [Anaeramoeba flamelloides]
MNLNTKIWVGSRELSQDISKYLARNTLSIDLQKTEETFENEEEKKKKKKSLFKDKSDPLDPLLSKNSTTSVNVHIFSNFDLIVISVSFLIPIQEHNQLQASLSICLPANCLKNFLKASSLFQDRSILVSARLVGLVLEREKKKLSKHQIFKTFTNDLLNFQNYIDAHIRSGILNPQLSMTIFHANPLIEKIPLKFFSCALTSMMQTCGCVLVIGLDEEEISYFIDSLSLFLTTQELSLSKQLDPPNVLNPEENSNNFSVGSLFKLNKLNDGSQRYIPDLFIQGIITDSFQTESLFESYYPSTIVDLNKKIVYQTPKFNYHQFHWKSKMRTFITQGSLSYKNIKFDLQEPLITTVKKASKSVQSFLNILFKLPLSLRLSYIINWKKLFYQKAIVLIRYTNSKL